MSMYRQIPKRINRPKHLVHSSKDRRNNLPAVEYRQDSPSYTVADQIGNGSVAKCPIEFEGEYTKVGDAY